MSQSIREDEIWNPNPY